MREFPNLINKIIFWIEDDPELIKRLPTTFKRVTKKNTIWAGSRDEALDILGETDTYYDIAVIDTMLPNTKKLRIENEIYFRRWGKLIKDIGKKTQEDSELDGDNKLLEDKKQLEEKIKANINQKSGIEILTEWKKNHTHNFKDTPILILTARDDNGLKDEIHSIFEDKKYGWLTKPVASTEIFETLSNLLLGEEHG